MTGRARRLALAALALAALGAGAVPASAEERIVAGPTRQYTTPQVTIDPGERVVFVNQDVLRHDVTARRQRADGTPLFASDLLDPGEQGPVHRAERLGPGSYAFYCSIHPDMTGTLNVSGQAAADTTAPTVRMRLPRDLAAVVRRARVTVRLRASEPADARVRGRVRAAGRWYRLRSADAALAPGAPRRVGLRLGRRARRALAEARRARVEVAVRAEDAAGNVADARRSGTLRR